MSRAVEDVLNAISVMPFEAPADRIHAEIRADLERRGQIIGAYDLLIAAHCLALDATLVTRNMREFSGGSGLKAEDWLAS